MLRMRPLMGLIRSPFMVRMFATKARIPPYTKDRYPVTRGNYAALTNADVSQFESILDKNRVLTEDDTFDYNIDWLRSVRGQSNVVLRPKTTEEVSEIMKYCSMRKLAVCPQGGNTGLVGGSVPVFDEVVVSLNLMNNIEYIDEFSGIVTCQSGAILENLDSAVREKGLCVPLDLGAKGSCHIGGNVSTNAGGLRLIRYGNLHGSVTGVEAVMANGQVMNLMSNFKKDNTGFHLKHLFIGSEGTLGIVTRLSIQCPVASQSVNVAFLGLNSYDDVMKTFLKAKRELGEILSAVEMIDEISLHCSTTVYNLNPPIGKFPFYMLIETSGSNEAHDEEKLNKFLQSSLNESLIHDGMTTNEPGKMGSVWELREKIPDSLIHVDGYCFKYDISLPLKQFYDIVPSTRKQCGELATFVCGYGHIGDSNLHLNIACKSFNEEIYSALQPFVFEEVSKVNGSISAEHGIGFHKPKYLKYSKSSEAIEFMRQIKQMMDPNGILNPYKVLP